MKGYRSLNRLYLLGCAGLSLLLVAIVLGNYLFPPRLELPPSAAKTPKIDTEKNEVVPKSELSDFGGTLQTRLRLAPPPVPVTVAPPVAPVTPPVLALPELVLVGTAMESDQESSMAWFQMPNRPIILARQGQRIDSLEGSPLLKSVEERKVVLLFGDREKILEIKGVVP